MHRRLIGGVMGAVLIIGTPAGAVAQSPEPSAWLGGRVEMPEHGFAVTLPDDWVGMDSAGDIEKQWEVVLEAWGAAAYRYADNTDMVGDLFMMSGPGLLTTQECDITVVPPGSAAIFRGMAEADRRRASNGDEVDRDIVEIKTVELTAGSTTVVDSVMLELLHFATYTIEREDRAVQLTCMAIGDRPVDDWLPLAESFEFLPTEG